MGCGKNFEIGEKHFAAIILLIVETEKTQTAQN